MNRKLRRHLNALTVTAALSLALPLTAMIAPLPIDQAKPVVSPALAPAAEVTAEQDAKAATQHRRRASSRDALSLPFFSFARTLRRGNGS